MATHWLKTWPEPYEAILSGRKKAEFRADDRDPRFAAGDYLHLSEWKPHPDGRRTSDGLLVGWYTARMIAARVTDVRRGPAFGIPEGFAMLSFEVLTIYPRSSEDG